MAGKQPPSQSPAHDLPASLVFRWWIDLRFVERGWADDHALTDAIVDALTATATAAHLDRVSVGGGAAIARGTAAALKQAFAGGKARYALLTGGKTIHSDDTPAWIELEISPRAASLSAAVSGAILAALGAQAFDDFFAVARSLHDALAGKAHLTGATAATNADDNTPEEPMVSDWPLRRIGDIVEPARPPKDDDDAGLFAARAIAAADAPAAATRSTHGGLVELRWVADPSEHGAADAAGIAHEAWMKGVVKHDPVS